MKFSQRSKTSLYMIENVSDSSRSRPGQNSLRHKQTQGIALVIVLLSAMVLMVSMLAISATMVISSQRTTVDQSATLQAQYAAEAGIARATANLAEIDSVMRQINVTNSTRTQIEQHIRNYCNGGATTFSDPLNGVICTVGSGNNTSRYSVFTTYIPSTAYPGGKNATTYWSDVFVTYSPSTKVSSETANSSETWYTVGYRNELTSAVAGPLTPTRVLLLGRNSYRFEFAVTPIRSDGEVRVGSRVIAARRVEQQNSGLYYIDVLLPSYARNFIFRDVTHNTVSPSNQLYFAGGESFGGPVHTNGTPGFAKISGTTPVFTDDFSSCARSGAYLNYSGSTTTYTSTDMQNTFQGSTPQFGIDPCIDLPQNSNNQKRAAFGGDANNKDAVTEDQMQAAWGVKYQTSTSLIGTVDCILNPSSPRCRVTSPMPNGIYYSKGNGSTTPNQDSTWNNDSSINTGGGIYIKGDVDEFKLSTTSDRQIISVKQGTNTTTFTQNADNTWTVRVGSINVKTLSGKFNGMVYVDGNINDMRGDGTNTADMGKNSQITVASTGKVLLKDDITYVNMPSADRPESEVDAALATAKSRNAVLGIYSSGDKCEPVAPSTPAGCGSIQADGGNNEDLNIHASIMATKEICSLSTCPRKGEGFGAIRNATNLGTVVQKNASLQNVSRKVQIKLFGGIIEKQSQTVGDLGSNGYARNYKYDRRFRDGFAPPFFPEQADGGESAVIARWNTNMDPNGIGSSQSVWQNLGNP